MGTPFREGASAPPLPTPSLAEASYEKEGRVGTEVIEGEGGWVDLTATPCGRKFYVCIFGNPDKPPLLFVPGVMNDLRKASVLSELVGPFAADFRVLALDVRNAGQTRPLTWEEEGAGDGFSHVAAYADDAAAVASVVFGSATKYYAAGFSSGALVATWVAHRYPRRVLGLANVAGGFCPDRMAEFAEGGLEDCARVLGPYLQIHEWIGEDNSEKLALAANTQLKAGSPALAKLVESVDAENAKLRANEGYDFQAMWRGGYHLRLLTDVCGLPPKESLAAIAPRTFIAGGRFDGLHKLGQVRDLKKAMPAATLEVFPAGHFQVCTYAAEKIAAFFKSLP